MTTNEIQILASLLNRLPMSPAEVAWVQGFIERLQAVVVPPPPAKIGESDQ